MTKLTLGQSMITLQPCALNAEFQHFILRFNLKNSLLCRYHWMRDKGWEQVQRHGEDRVTLQITLSRFPHHYYLKAVLRPKWCLHAGHFTTTTHGDALRCLYINQPKKLQIGGSYLERLALKLAILGPMRVPKIQRKIIDGGVSCVRQSPGVGAFSK
jgi:hypothetical protein